MTPDEWKRLIRFLAAQDVRTPAWFIQQAKRLDEELPDLMKTTMENAIQELERATKSGEPDNLRSVSPEVRKDLPLRVTVRRNPSGGGEIGAEILRGRQLWLWTIERHLTKNIPALLQHQWTVLAPAKGMTWFTSDNPVVRLNYNSFSDYNFNGGWDSVGTEIFLPLDADHLLFTHVGQRARERGDRMTQEETNLIRRFIAEHAYRMIFAAQPDDELSTSLFLDYSQFLILFDVRNKGKMDAFLLEVIRRLHNFVASAMTLVDHTRNIARDLYQGSQFWPVYQSEIDTRFKSNPLAQFVKDLRNYTLHHDLPLASASLSSKFETAIRLDIATLRSSHRWTAQARAYLDLCGDDEKIETVIDDYYKLVAEFHDWFFESQKRLHQNAFDEANALRLRLANSKWHHDDS